MPPRILTVDPVQPQPAVVAEAADVLRRGGLVAFPTETVYGLGADALCEAAVRRIFAAKGRPATNPVIVHVNDAAAARRLTTAWPDLAERCARRWWPGPLTLVLPKAEPVPEVVTAGGPTVAVRVPVHPVARALIAAAGRPLAAPSANPSLRVSATLAEHVVRGLGERVDLILDGGPTRDGLESTVVDLSGPTPRVLRPGPISFDELREVLGPALIPPGGETAVDETAPLPSPGLLKKHYAPTVPLRLTRDDGGELVRTLSATGRRIGWIPLAAAPPTHDPQRVVCRPLPRDPGEYGRRLYATLHELDQSGVAEMVVELPPADDAWSAVRDRLTRAAAG